MGLSLRHSIRVGPLRVTFSKSGIGVSTGIRRIRPWTALCAVRVHVGTRGLQYHQSLGGSRSNAIAGPTGARRKGRRSRGAPVADTSPRPIQVIDGAAVLTLTAGSADGVLDQIRRSHATPAIGPWAVGGAILVFLMTLGADVRGWVLAPLGLACIGAAYWGLLRDARRRAVVVDYDLERTAADHYEAVLDAFDGLEDAEGLWHVPPEDRLRDRPASKPVRRDPIRPAVGAPRALRTNLDAPLLTLGRRRLFFFPDRLLVFDGDRVTAVPYGDLAVEIATAECVDEQRVPRDAQVVAHTWRHVDRNGEPDRRFKDNPQLPVALYETIHFRSSTGLNELVHASRTGVGAPVAEALAALAALARPGAKDTAAPSPETGAPATHHGRSTEVGDGSPGLERPRPADATSLRRGKTAAVIAERAAGWEYRTFALALADVLANLPPAEAPGMPGRFAVAAQVVEWAKGQLEAVRQVCTGLNQHVNVDLPAAATRAAATGDPDAILDIVWKIGKKVAWARAWARVVKATDVPSRFNPLREELARTLDPPLKTLAAFGPDLLTSLEARRSGAAAAVPKLALTIQNQEALKQAVKTAMS
jgi:hypothetical protein